MPIVIGARREGDFPTQSGCWQIATGAWGFFEVLMGVARQAHGAPLSEDELGAFGKGLPYLRDRVPKRTAGESDRKVDPKGRRIASRRGAAAA